MTNIYPQFFKQIFPSFPPKQNRSLKEIIRQIAGNPLKKRQNRSCPQLFWEKLKFTFPLIDTTYQYCYYLVNY